MFLDISIPKGDPARKNNNYSHVSVARLAVVDSGPVVYGREKDEDPLKVFSLNEYMTVTFEQQLVFADRWNIMFKPYDVFHIMTKREIGTGYKPILPAKDRTVQGLSNMREEVSTGPSNRTMTKKPVQCIVLCFYRYHLTNHHPPFVGIRDLQRLPEQEGAPTPGLCG
jgi:hypothetical protein